MPAPHLSPTAALPQDAQQVLQLAAQSLFGVFAEAALGMMVVDRDHRVVWISEGYKAFLPALGFAREEDFVGRPVEEVVPNTMMNQVIEAGRPIVLDLLTNRAGTFLVSRLPLRDADGEVIGAVGMVWLNESPDHRGGTMQPLMAKFSRLQKELDDTRRALAAERRPKYTIASFVGSHPSVVELKRQARRVAGTDSTVLLLGETGTGKELMAQAIHAGSHRAAGPFVGVNIAAVPDTLLEAEFFGVAPGAFTGADRKARPGKFQLADGGTLFLDEIGDMPLALQAKLLRVLQEQEVEPLGSQRVQPVDVRVIAATSRDLPRMVAEGQFRADLFYRLNVLPLRLPALRERLTDLDALADHLLEDIGRRSGLTHRSLGADALECLAAHGWPGNIRELRNLLEQACLLSDELVIGAAQVAPLLAGARGQVPSEDGPVRAAPGARAGTGPDAGLAPPEEAAGASAAIVPPPTITPLPVAVAALEAESIRAALAATGGNKLAAARLLGISRATLYEKLTSGRVSTV
jgi:transcriptional regulator with PAS, ATPase and Fis domain